LDAVQNGAGSSKEAFTPAPSGVATTPNKTASAAKTKPKKPPVGTGYPETQAAKDARLGGLVRGSLQAVSKYLRQCTRNGVPDPGPIVTN